MKCFYHHERDAVGRCQTCGKGVCPECAVDLGTRTTCHGACEAEARKTMAIMDRLDRDLSSRKSILARTRTTDIICSLGYLLSGGIFLYFGLREPKTGIGTALGVFLLVLGVATLLPVLLSLRQKGS